MEERYEPMKIIREPMEIVSGDHKNCFPFSSAPCNACLDKSDFKNKNLIFENKLLKYRAISKPQHLSGEK